MTPKLRRPRVAILSAIAAVTVTGLPASFAAPGGVTATKDDGVPAATRKLKGDSVTYTNKITNASPTLDATNVQFADPDVTDATVVAGSLNATPVAVDDTYPQTVVANMSVNTAASAFSVLTNDFLGYKNSAAAVLATDITITAFQATSAHGGTVSMTTSGAGVGQFVYTPAPGYTGADSFTYTISNGITGALAASTTATLNLTVGGTVTWFVNTSTGDDTTGKGTLASPFKTIDKAATTSSTGQNIFVYTGSYTTTAANGISLKATQKLVGQGSLGGTFDTVLLGITPGGDTPTRPSLGGTKPTLGNTTTNGNVITLANADTISGIAVNAAAGTGKGIIGSSITTGTIGLSSDTTISGCAGGALSLGSGNGNIDVTAIITNTSGNSVAVGNRTGGTVSFTSAITDSGAGINLTSNGGTTINFSGGIAVTIGSGTAFSATGGGTVNVTDNLGASIVNTLSASSGTGLNVSNTNIGASGLSFNTISAGNSGGATGGNGITLNTTGNAGSLLVRSTGTAGSGGTIQRKSGTNGDPTTGTGIYLNSTKSPSFARMQINDCGNHAIRGNGVAGFTMTNSVVNGTNGDTTGQSPTEGGAVFSELTGTVSVSNTTFSGALEDNFQVKNSSGAATITLNAITIGANSLANGNDGLTIETTGSAVVNASVTNSFFTAARGDLFQLSNNGLGGDTLTFTGNTLSNNHGGISTGGGGVSLAGSATATDSFTINNNTFRDAVGPGVLIVKPTGTGTLNGSFNNNTVGVAGTANSGSKEGSAVKFQTVGAGKIDFDVVGNSINQYNNNGLEIVAGGGASAQSGDLVFRVTGNTTANPGNDSGTAGIPKNGFHLNLGTVPSDTFQAYLTLGGTGADANNFSAGGKDAIPATIGDTDIRLRQRQTTTVHLYAKNGASTTAYAGANNDATAVQNFVNGNQTGTTVSLAQHTVATGGGGFVGTPSTPPLLMFAPAEPVMVAGVSMADATVEPVAASEARVETAAPVVVAAEQSAPASVSAPLAPREINQAELEGLVTEARSVWESTGLTTGQKDLLQQLRFEVADLPAPRLGQAAADSIRVSRNAGGNGWSTERDASGFDKTLSVTRLGSSSGQTVDLLTTLLHEMGHALGLEDSYEQKDRDSIMYGYLTRGERRLPAKGQAEGAVPHLDGVGHFLTGSLNPITIPVLPAGKDVVITYSVTINNSITAGQISSQGTVTGTQSAAPFTVLTDDPNAGGASDATITLVGIPPVFTNGNATTFTVGTLGSFSFAASGQPASTFTTASTLPGGVTLASNGTLSGTPVAGSGGTYSLTVTAANGVAPNATQNFTLTVNQAPAITSANTTTFAVGSAGSFTVTTTGFPSGGGMTLTKTGSLPSGVTFTDNGNGTATIAGTPAAATGSSYPITIGASNGVGSPASQSFTLVVNQVSAFTSVNATTFTVGSAGNFPVVTTGYPNAAITETGVLPGGVSFTDNGDGTAAFAGTPNAGAGGIYPITLIATNGVGSPVNQSFTLTVNQAPAITSANNTTFTVGSAGSFTVTTSGFPSGATMVIGESGSLPSGVSFTDNGNGTATLSGTPAALTGGSYPITINANNGIGTPASQGFTLTVNQAPVITSADNTSFTATLAGTFTVTTTGYPTPVFSETGSLPSGVTFVDNGNGTATLAGTPTSLSAGTYPLTITANNGVGTQASQSFTLTVKPPVDHFTVTAPANATAGTAVNVTVTALDASNVVVPNYQGTVHFTSTDAQADLPANYAFTVGDNGSHTFSVTLKTAGTRTISVSDTITASAAGTSNSITVGAGADAKLVFVQQPSTAVAGVANTPAVTVKVQDAYGNDTTGTPNVTLALGNAGTATLGGTLTKAAVNGVATFNDLTVDKVGTTYNLGATSGVLTGATSNNFTITPAAATHLAVTAPANATAGTAFNVTVTALDAFNNTATGYTGTAHFTSSDAAATLPADGTLTNGVGTFSTTLKTAGSRTITATDTVTGSITGTSNSITVGAGADAKLVFVQQPSTTVAGVSIAPAVTVQIQDTFGNPATTSTANVTVALGNAGGATLSGTATQAAVVGVATFNNLSVDKVGTTYNLGVTSGVLIGATSNNFTITPAAATHYAVTAPSTATAGTAFNVTVTALDQFNNTATGYTGIVHFTSTDGAATLPANYTFLAGDSGVHTFSATLKTAGSRTITATDTVTSSITGTSNSITVGAGADAKLVFVQQPSTTVAGVSITPAVTVQIQDIFGNPTASTANVTVALGNANGATLSGTATQAAVAGVATFNNLSVDKVGTTYNLGATSGVLTGATSNNFTITPAAATHYTVTAPSTATAGTAFNVTVTALDQFNNTATGYAGSVHFTSSDASATLPANSTLTNGVGTFSATLQTAGARTITATDTVTSSITGTSNSITVNPAAATHYTVSAPANATAGTAFNVTVTALDQFNNTATGYAGTVHFTSSDAAATLPANGTLTNGVGTFSATLKTAGSRTITATDTVTGSINGTSSGIAVTAGADAKLVFVQQPSTTVAGVSIAPAVTVQIQDTFGNPTTSTANVTVALGNANGATLSGTATQAAVAGVATFGNLSVNKVGTTYNLGASSGALTGATSNNFTITPAAANHYTVSAPANATAGTAFNVTVTALDQFNNTATGYTGTAHFTSTDGAAVLPVNSTLTNGVGTFSTTLKTGGNQTITATDTVTGSITGTSGNVNVDPRSDLAVTVTDSPDPVNAGTNLTYTINVVNNGPSAAASVSLADTLPSGTTFVSLSSPGGWSSTTPAVGSGGTINSSKATVAPGETASFTLVVKVAASVINGTVISNTATVATTTTELSNADNSATATTTVTASADLAVTVTDSPDPVNAGTNLTYTIAASNAGPSDATSVSLSDTLPSGTTFVSVTTPGGWSATTPAVGSGGTVTFTRAVFANTASDVFTVVVKVNSSVAAGTVLSNTATVTASSTDPTPGNNSATATTTVSRSADLAITVVDTPDPVNATENVTYTATVTNNGPSDAQSAAMTFPFPATVTFVSASTPSGWVKTSVNNVGDATGSVTYTAASVAAAATADFTIVFKVNATAPNNSHLVTTATVTASTTDPASGNNSFSTDTLVKSGADLVISGSASTPAVAGSDVTYTFTATNNGPLDANNAVVTSVLPVGTTFVSAVTPSGWTLDGSSPAVGSNGTVTFTRPLFANAATADFTVVAHINANVASGTVLHDGIAASSSTLDVFPLNNSASLDSTVVTRADLAVTLTATPDPVLANDNLTYTITVANNGPSDATGASVSLPLASSTTFVSASGWTVAAPPVGSTGTVTFTGGSITHGTSATLTVVTKVVSGTSNGSTISATATASGGSDLDPNLANNSGSKTVEVGTVDPTVLQLATTGTLNRQTGLFELNVKVTNTTPHAINGFRLHVDYSSYLVAYPSLRLWNATGLTPAPYVDYPYPVAIDGVVNVKLVFYTSTRTFPPQFSPILTVEKLLTSQPSDTNGSGVHATLKRLLDGTNLIEFPSVTGHWYRVRYSSDMVHWNDCPVPLQAGGSKTQWIDSGAPFTNISPADPSVTSRFYIVNEIPAPTP